MTVISNRVIIELEKLTDGTKVYFARDIDLEGLMAHGDTPDAAANSLEEARAVRMARVAARGVEAKPETVRAPAMDSSLISWMRDGVARGSRASTAYAG